MSASLVRLNSLARCRAKVLFGENRFIWTLFFGIFEIMKEHSHAVKMNTSSLAQQWLEHLSKPLDNIELCQEWKAKGKDLQELEEKVTVDKKSKEEEKK
ncbi:hypothetical protein L3Y34_016332 [Caenorhabditis briggsae]|uniref:Uncharacterized protein n=1 Tax=Caenorhabditis briggsae TaxID=6238 RepID=A0AAE9J104_CAEBR|nr:hypothetical protein L3Y34_016332 [Caenorhabditis briggsae]